MTIAVKVFALVVRIQFIMEYRGLIAPFYICDMETPVIFLPIAIILGIIVVVLYEIGKHYFKKLSQYIKDATLK